MGLLKICVAVSLLCLLAPAAFADSAAPIVGTDATPAFKAGPSPQSKGPTINIHVDPAVLKLNAPYDEAVKKLAPEQVAVLKSIDDDFGKTMEADTQIIDMGFKLKTCSSGDGEIAKNPSKYQAEFGVFRNQLQAAQQTERTRLHEKRATLAPFIDQKVLDDHMQFEANMMVGMARGLMQAAYEQGTAAKKVDCKDVVQKLDTAFQQVNATPNAAPQGSVDRIAAIKAAAERGDPQAMTSYGMLQISGNGVPQDQAKGVAQIAKAADTGYDYAQYMLGLCYASGIGGPVDKENGKLWLGKAAAQGYKKAQAMLANIDKMPAPESLEETRKKAEAGNAQAQDQLGGKYAYGLGVEKNFDEGLKWTLLSAGQGYPMAESNAAHMLFSVGRNAEALDWDIKAAQSGFAESQYELATIYLDGKLVPKDTEKAAFWCKKAADGGDPRAAKLLAQLGSH
jgi:TPR repeat protein